MAAPAPSSGSAPASTSLLSALTSPAYSTAVYLARQACLSLFSRLDSAQASGLLVIQEKSQPDSPIVYGSPVAKRAWNVQQQKLSRQGQLGADDAAPQQSHPSDKLSYARLNVESDTFWIRLVLGNDLGFAEAYMGGEVSTPDLGACFKLFIDNRDVLSNMSVGPLAKVTSTIQALLNRRYANTKRGSLRNIGAHYDISNTMYEAFLSADMTYSCAIFPTLDADVDGQGPLLAAAASAAAKADTHGDAESRDGAARGMTYRSKWYRSPQRSAVGGPNGSINHVNGVLTPESSRGISSPTSPIDDELEEAQLRKLRTIIERADLRPGHRVLEIGTGWGSLAIEAVRSSGCQVDSLTLSVEQKALAETRIAAAGLSDRIRVHLMDYRDMPASWVDRFDRVVSVEMLEAVGIEFLSTYFSAIDRVLTKEGGVLVFQCITMPEERFQTYIETVDFIKRWIFPGGVLPSVTALMQAVERGAKRGLVLDTVHSIGPHYARTLREWRQRFEAHFVTTIKPALLRDHVEIRKLKPEEQERECQVFRRKWIYYFVYCEVGFTERVIGDHIMSFTRTSNKSLPVCCGS